MKIYICTLVIIMQCWRKELSNKIKHIMSSDDINTTYLHNLYNYLAKNWKYFGLDQEVTEQYSD